MIGYSGVITALFTPSAEEAISKAELRLTDIAEALQGDWVALARQLGISEDEITKIQSEYTYVSEQALVMLHLWVQKNRNRATGLFVHCIFHLGLNLFLKMMRFHLTAMQK